jgi:lysophospholipase L1-like esterase
LTENWLSEGAYPLWKEKYQQPYNAINLGIGGDEVHHLVWRVQNGALEHLSPRVLVVMIGTNNVGNSGHPEHEIAAGIHLLITELKTRLPSTKILLLGVLPRDEYPNTWKRRYISALNKVLRCCHDGQTVVFADIGAHFLDDAERISPELMYDFLHLTPKGYQVWADYMDSYLKEVFAIASAWFLPVQSARINQWSSQ